MSVSEHAEVALHSVQNIRTCPSLPPAMDVQIISLDRITRLQHFFTLQNREVLNQNFGNRLTTTIGLLSEEPAN